jgi:hypothetical protein
MMKENDRDKPEKLYTKPTLTLYGRVSELTATLGLTSTKDSGTGTMQKTNI